MSVIEKKEIKCPNCGNPITINAYTSINVKLEPELREKVLSGKIFEYTCEHCYHHGHMGYPFLYHDPNNKFLIQYSAPQDAQKHLETFKNNYKNVKNVIPNLDEYRYRVVDQFALLGEKIEAFEHGLDDRILEITKILVGTMLEKQNHINENERIYLYKIDEGFRVDILDTKENTIRQIRLKDEPYRIVKKDYESHLENNNVDIVNEEWASDFLNKIYKSVN